MGKTEHQEFTKLSDGKTAVIASKNVWKSADGKPVLSDRRRFTFGSGQDGSHTIDCEILLIASEGDLHFGDTKEGTFAVRVNEAIKVDAKKGGKIINSVGDKDGDAWGKPADWVDYYGPINGNTVGMAILCHPSTFHYPNRWHVRNLWLVRRQSVWRLSLPWQERNDGWSAHQERRRVVVSLSRDHSQRR